MGLSFPDLGSAKRVRVYPDAEEGSAHADVWATVTMVDTKTAKGWVFKTHGIRQRCLRRLTDLRRGTTAAECPELHGDMSHVALGQAAKAYAGSDDGDAAALLVAAREYAEAPNTHAQVIDEEAAKEAHDAEVSIVEATLTKLEGVTVGAVDLATVEDKSRLLVLVEKIGLSQMLAMRAIEANNPTQAQLLSDGS
jgi:hypothetical protein